MIFYFSTLFFNFIFNLQVDVRICHQRLQFDEGNHLNDRLIIIYFETILNHKLIVILLKLSFHKIMLWFDVFHDNMSDLINVFKHKCWSIKDSF
jgi:hypothetical protein